MKKIIYLMALFFIGVNYTSCTPESLVDQLNEQACCGDDIPPPPPPPPPGGGDRIGE